MEFWHATKRTCFAISAWISAVGGGRLGDEHDAATKGHNLNIDLIRSQSLEQIANVPQGKVPVGLIA